MSKTLTELKAERDALDQRIANHKPLGHSAAISKLCAYVTEHDMTEDDLFPEPIDPEADFKVDIGATHDFWEECFPEFEYEDTFGYTFIEDLKAQRNEVDSEIRAIRREAIERARAFIQEYRLTKKDVFSSPD